MSEGQWLVLATANFMLEDVKELCELRGWYYKYKNKNSIDIKLLLALQNWEQWSKEDQIQGATHLLGHIEIKNIYRYLGTNVADGFREVNYFTLKKNIR